jgi:hypothetical protein
VSLASLLTFFAWLTPAQADIYKYTDPNGHTTYSSAPIRGATKLHLPPSPSSPRAPEKISPPNFPKVDNGTQKNRDNMRRQILENELAHEERLLSETRFNLEQAQAKGQDTTALRDELKLHEKNRDALRTELGNIR